MAGRYYARFTPPVSTVSLIDTGRIIPFIGVVPVGGSTVATGAIPVLIQVSRLLEILKGELHTQGPSKQMINTVELTLKDCCTGQKHGLSRQVVSDDMFSSSAARNVNVWSFKTVGLS